MASCYTTPVQDFLEAYPSFSPPNRLEFHYCQLIIKAVRLVSGSSFAIASSRSLPSDQSKFRPCHLRTLLGQSFTTASSESLPSDRSEFHYC